MNLFITYASQKAETADEALAYFNAGYEAFEGDGQSKFIIDYVNKIADRTELIASLNDPEILKKIMSVNLNLAKADPTFLSNLWEIKGDLTNAEFIDRLSSSLPDNLPIVYRKAFFEDLIEARTENDLWKDKDFEWILTETSAGFGKELLIDYIDKSKLDATRAMGILADALTPSTQDKQDKFMPIIKETLKRVTTEELGGPDNLNKLKESISNMVSIMNEAGILELNTFITQTKHAKELRPALINQLIKYTDYDTILLIANNPSNIKLSDVGIDTAYKLLEKIHPLDVNSLNDTNKSTIIKAMLKDNTLEDLTNLLEKSKDSPDLINTITRNLIAINDPNIKTAIKGNQAYSDIYVLYKIDGLKNTTDAVEAAGLLLKAHYDAKGNPLLQDAIEKYYNNYVGQLNQATVILEGTDLSAKISKVSNITPEALDRLFGKASTDANKEEAHTNVVVSIEDDVVTSTTPDPLSNLKPVNLLLFDFKFLVKLNEAHEKYKVPETPDPKGLLSKIAEWLSECFSKFRSDNKMKEFATTFEEIMTTDLTFQSAAVVGETPTTDPKNLTVNKDIPVEDVPEFAKEAFKKAAITKKSFAPNEVNANKVELSIV